MASGKKKNKSGGVIIGPVIVVAALSGLWKNETRFDYHKAAKSTPHVTSVGNQERGQNFSFSGDMDQSLKLPGKYITTFTGYLIVHRSAEIYCWERDEDDDGDVTWRKRWMSSVESNNRNNGIRQTLKSGRILPPTYRIADLDVSSRLIEFVDPKVTINPAPLPRTEEGKNLSVEDNYLMRRKNQPQNLGDERLGYRAIPVPSLATYFGRFDGEKGVPDTSDQRSGFINSMIQNSGVLHHLVAGDRDAALETMKQHIKRLKWIIRIVGTVLIVFGLLIFFSFVLRFLYSIPLIGALAQSGAFLMAIAIGLPLALITILLGFVAGNPIVLIPIIILLLAGIWFMIRASKRQRIAGEKIKEELESEYGHPLEFEETKAIKYQEMAGMLASGENKIGADEEKLLNRFAKKSGFKEEERENLLKEAKAHSTDGKSPEAHLRNLIRISVADATLTPHEIRSIRDAAELAGYDRQQFRELMASVTEMPEMKRAS